MARHPRLRGPLRAGRLAALAVLVLLAHGAVLELLSRLQVQAAVLRPMVAPMYTRVLQPQTPPAVTVASARPAAPAPALPQASLRTAAKSQPEPTPTVAVAEPAPEPAPPPRVEERPPATTVAEATSTIAEPTASPSVTPTATATAAPVDRWPADTRLTYRLGGRFRSGDLYGDARVQWQRDGPRYQVRVDVNVTLLASLVMTSQGEVTPEGLAPRAYEELRSGRPRSLRMNEREVLLANGNALPRPAGLQDTASQFVELSHRFASGREALQVGRTVSFWMARPGAVDLWTYDIVAREVLKTAKLGEIEAFHLKPRPIANPRGNITAEMWFAPSLQYLPVRIRVNMGEEAHLDLLVDTIEQK